MPGTSVLCAAHLQAECILSCAASLCIRRGVGCHLCFYMQCGGFEIYLRRATQLSSRILTTGKITRVEAESSTPWPAAAGPWKASSVASILMCPVHTHVSLGRPPGFWGCLCSALPSDLLVCSHTCPLPVPRRPLSLADLCLGPKCLLTACGAARPGLLVLPAGIPGAFSLCPDIWVSRLIPQTDSLIPSPASSLL